MVVGLLDEGIPELGAVRDHTLIIIGETVLTRVVGHGVVLSSSLPLAGVNTVEACGAVSIRAVVIGADILTIGVLATLWSGFHLIANCSTAVNIHGPGTYGAHGVLEAHIK